jgi:hypothetical protein
LQKSWRKHTLQKKILSLDLYPRMPHPRAHIALLGFACIIAVTAIGFTVSAGIKTAHAPRAASGTAAQSQPEGTSTEKKSLAPDSNVLTAPPQTTKRTTRFPWTDGNCTGTGPVPFTAPPMHPEDIGSILPMGLVVDAHVTPIDHQYYSPLLFNSAPDRYEVMAPADGAIVAIQHRSTFIGDNVPKGKEHPDEYRIYIEYSCTFWSYYDLVTKLAPDIQTAWEASPNKERGGLVRIPVTAGQVIGKIGGQTLDVGVINSEVTLSGFTTPALYEREPWKIHTVDPFPYFTPSLQKTLLAKNPRRAEPRGGKIDYDIPGKLIGNWFQKGTNGYAGVDPKRSWAGHIAFLPDYIDPAQFRISLGTFDGRSQQFAPKGNGPDPATIGKETGVVAYELKKYMYINKKTGEPWNRGAPTNTQTEITSKNLDKVYGTVLVQVLDAQTIKMEVFEGKTADAVSGFTESALFYER